jgi:hypothetical protein
MVNWCFFLVIFFTIVSKYGFIGKGQRDSSFLVDVQNSGSQRHYFHTAKGSVQAQGFEICVLIVGRPKQHNIVLSMWCFHH